MRQQALTALTEHLNVFDNQHCYRFNAENLIHFMKSDANDKNFTKEFSRIENSNHMEIGCLQRRFCALINCDQNHHQVKFFA